MVWGAAVFTVYGLWQVCARLPAGLSIGTRAGSAAWAIGLFAGAGAVIGAAVSAAALLVSWPLRPSRRATAAAAFETALLTLLFCWVVLNEFLYSTTSEVLGPEAILLVWHNTAAVFENAWEMGARYLLATLVLTLAAGVLIYRFLARSLRRLHPGPRVLPSRHHVRVMSLAASLTGGLVVLAVLLAWQFHYRPSAALIILCRSAPPLRAFNLTRTLLGNELAGEAPNEFGSPIISEDAYVESMGTPRAPAPNVVYILMESTPARALHCYGHAKSDITPNIDALAAGGVLFEHCLGTASFSSCSLTSMVTSLYMLRGERFDYFVGASFPFLGLPRALKLAGYELALFSSGNESFDNISRFYPPSDFDVYFSHDTCDIPKDDCMRMDDKYAVGRFESWLARRTGSRPFYCGFYLQSPHFNYEVPEPWFSHYLPIPPLYSNGDGILHIPPDVLPKLKNQYDNAMRYADYWVGRIRDALNKAGEWDNTVVVITGDHGEAFMEHGLARHGTHTWEEMIHIPLILYAGPGLRAALPHALPSRVPDTVSGIDIAPTVADLIGIRPHGSWQGVNVLEPGYDSQDRPIFSMTQYTRWQEVVCINRLKYIYDLSDVQEYLFDLRTDPGERHNLAGANPELAAALRELLSGWHTRQLTYYSPENQPATHYIGRYEPDRRLLDRIRVAASAPTEGVIARSWGPYDRTLGR